MDSADSNFHTKSADPTLQSLSLDGVVGIVSNGQNIITINTTALEQYWENMLDNNGIKTDLTNFEIIKAYDQSNIHTGYMLTATASDENQQNAILLIYNPADQSYSVEPASETRLQAITYTCRGCNTCRLKIDRFPSGRLKQVNCHPGCARSSCTKTESVTL